jgi:hypothetical protein
LVLDKKTQNQHIFTGKQLDGRHLIRSCQKWLHFLALQCIMSETQFMPKQNY